MKNEQLIHKQKEKSVKQTIQEIMSYNYNPLSIHPSRLEGWSHEEAIKLLAEQVDTLWAIVKAYKTGKL